MVNRKKSKEIKVFYSMIEFKKKYLPKSFKKQIFNESKDTHDLGISWAKESLDKIKDQLEQEQNPR